MVMGSRGPYKSAGDKLLDDLATTQPDWAKELYTAQPQLKICPSCRRTFGGWETTGGPPPCQLPWGGQRPIYPGCLLEE